LVEGYLFQPLLQKMRLAVFPRSSVEKERYFEYIPFTWTGINNRDDACFGAQLLYDMMVISLLNYQAI